MTSPTTPALRPLRADAQRNRGRIVAAARAAVAERGGDIALEDVARAAGVGIGTLYRHFPSRQELLEAAFVHEAEELTEDAQSLAGAGSPLDALVGWLRRQVELGSHGHAMGAAVMAAKHVEGTDIQRACSAMRDAGAVLLGAAQEAGQVRSDVQLGDVLRLVHGIALAAQQSPDPERDERMLALVVAGIRA